MHHLISVIDDTTNSATPAEMAAIDAFTSDSWRAATGCSRAVSPSRPPRP